MVKAGRRFPWVALAVLLFAGWRSHDLLCAWQHSPHDRLGWVVLFLWLLPLALRLSAGGATGLLANVYWLGAAVAFGLLSALTELHFLGHLALALALMAWLAISWRSGLWLLTAVSWMPVFGWCLENDSAAAVFSLRLLLVAAGVFAFPPIVKTSVTR